MYIGNPKQHESTAHSTATVAVMARMFSAVVDIVNGIQCVPGQTGLMIHGNGAGTLSSGPAPLLVTVIDG